MEWSLPQPGNLPCLVCDSPEQSALPVQPSEPSVTQLRAPSMVTCCSLSKACCCPKAPSSFLWGTLSSCRTQPPHLAQTPHLDSAVELCSFGGADSIRLFLPPVSCSRILVSWPSSPGPEPIGFHVSLCPAHSAQALCIVHSQTS